MKVQDAVLACLNNGMTHNGEIAVQVRNMIPGANTSSASVSSIRSRLKQDANHGLGPNVPAPDRVRFDPLASSALTAASAAFDDEPDDRTDTDIASKIRKNLRLLRKAGRLTVEGINAALIVSGPAGMGKSHEIRAQLMAKYGPRAERDPYQCAEVSGSITAVGLYIALWRAKNGGIVILDDCDSIFGDEEAMNILKAVLDPHGPRLVSWRKKAHWLVEECDGDDTFKYEGSVIFITNVDLIALTSTGRRNEGHYKALIDRCFYVDMNVHHRRDLVVWLGLLAPEIIPDDGKCEVEVNGKLQMVPDTTTRDAIMDVVAEYRDKFRWINLRLLAQARDMYKTWVPEDEDDDDWVDLLLAMKSDVAR